MKATLLLMIMGIALLMGAPNTVHKGSLTFVWDPPNPLETVEAYNLYVSTNLPPGITTPLTPDGEDLLSVVLPPEATNMFKFYMTIPGNQTSVTLTNIWSELGSWAFFTITASNRVGESPFSNPAALLAPLSGRGGLRLQLGP